MDVVRPYNIAASLCGHLDRDVFPSDEKVRRGASREYGIGTLFEEMDGFYVVVECVPKTSLFGPRWDIRLHLASPDVHLAAEVMLT